MNKDTYSIFIKLIATFLITWITFTVFAYSTFSYILILSVAVTIFGFLGDKLLLGRFGNISASIGDGALAAITAYFIALVFNGVQATTFTFIVYALLTVVSEYLFHMYLMNNDEEVEDNEIRRTRPTYNMETSDEFDDTRHYEEQNIRKSKEYNENSEDDSNFMMEASDEFNENVLDETDLRKNKEENYKE